MRRLCLIASALAALVCASAADARPQTPPPSPVKADGRAFRGDGMWIWYVSKAEGGSPARIAAKARARGIETVFIKSADGDDLWSQFTPELVAELKRRGLNVCAWQYVYGADPVGEAEAGAQAKARGADCLVIDAESEYEGRYASASTYVETLRDQVGAGYPLALAAFPYVHYHPAFPYSVFLGPGAAEFNLPQVYWRAIGTSVEKALTTTYTYNRVYGRAIAPIGQLYENPPKRQVIRFRRLAAANGFAGVSWWSWQHASKRGWRAAGKRKLKPARGVPRSTYPALERGAEGDLVVWAQQHLAAGGFFGEPVDGEYGLLTSRATREFQGTVGLEPTGVLDELTWEALVAELDPLAVDWSRRRGAPAGTPPPRSAALAPRADELARD